MLDDINKSRKMTNIVHLGDCLVAMKEMPDKAFDLAICDPEYGRKEHGGVDRSGLAVQKNGSVIRVKGGDYKKKEWDNKPADKEYFDQLFRVSKHQIIWGCNYYYTNFGPGRIIWDKCNDGSDQSDAEIAYNSLTERVDMFRYMWRGMFQGKSITEGHIQKGNKALNEKRIHPTQKPADLYKWLIISYANIGWTILDTHTGSGSSRIAAYDLNHSFTGYEIDSDYYKAQELRFERHKAQLNLFA
jgi:site-specific DNA-methyltransferase (adenine-specific)